MLLYDFLNDYGYLWWQFVQVLRDGGEDDEVHGHGTGATLDLLWREAYHTMRTTEANKTQYGWMAPYKLFWSNALVDGLKQVHDEMRTLSLTGNPSAQVGWDMLPENLNLQVKEGINPPVTEEYIEEYCENLIFCSPVSMGLQQVLPGQGRKPTNWRKKVDDDTQRIIDMLRLNVGETWQEATNERPIDHSIFLPHNATETPHQRKMSVAYGAGARPESYAQHVARILEQKCPFV
jgi:hypothetical protein